MCIMAWERCFAFTGRFSRASKRVGLDHGHWVDLAESIVITPLAASLGYYWLYIKLPSFEGSETHWKKH